MCHAIRKPLLSMPLVFGWVFILCYLFFILVINIQIGKILTFLIDSHPEECNVLNAILTKRLLYIYKKGVCGSCPFPQLSVLSGIIQLFREGCLTNEEKLTRQSRKGLWVMGIWRFRDWSLTCISIYIIAQVIRAFLLVLAYELLVDRCTIDVIITKFFFCILKWRKVLRI